MKSISYNPFIATFQLLSAASLNVGRSQNGVLGNGLKPQDMYCSAQGELFGCAVSHLLCVVWS